MLSTIDTPVRPAPVETPTTEVTGITNRPGADGFFSPDELSEMAIICRDIGGTLLENVKLLEEAYAATGESKYRIRADDARIESVRIETMRRAIARLV